jgi:membrane protein
MIFAAMPATLLRILRFLGFVFARFKEDRCPQVAASLAYTTLLALVPLITIALTVFSAFPVFTELMTQLKIFMLTNLVPESAGKIISVYMRQFSERAGRLTAVGVVFLGVTAFLLMYTIDHAFNVIWRVRRPRPLLQRFLIYWAGLTLGPLLMGASLSLTYYLVSLSLGLAKGIPYAAVITLKLVPFGLTTLAFGLLYLIIPNRSVSVRHALIGGVVAGAGFGVMERVFTLYLTHFPTYTLVYGAFAVVPIFLLWIYLSWLVVLSGAVLVASLPYWRSNAWNPERKAGRQFYDALRILGVLYREQRDTGRAVSFQTLQAEAQVAPEDLEEILDRLAAVNWVDRVAGNAWVLSRNPAAIRVADVYREFVFAFGEPSSLPSPLRTKLQAMLGGMTAGLEESLSSLFEATPEGGSRQTGAN